MAAMIPMLVLGLLALATAEVLWRKRTGRPLIPRPTGSSTNPVAASGLGAVDDIFNPARHHEVEQKQTSLMMRDEAGDAAPPVVDLDLNAGKARMKR